MVLKTKTNLPVNAATGNSDLPEGFKMTELGLLPEEWEVVRLGDIGQVITGRTPPTAHAHYWNGAIPFITPVDLKGEPIHRAERTITKQGLTKAKPLPKGAVLVSCIGYIGKIGVVDAELAVTNQQISAVLCQNADNWFLAYALMAEVRLLEARARMTTVPILHKANFERVPVPLPPLPEQRAIAQVLRTVQRAKEATERVIAATRELKKSLMRHLFTYGPVPIDQADQVQLQETEIGPVLEGWEVVRLGEVATFQGGTQPPKRDFVYHPKEGYVRLLQIRDFESDENATYVKASSRLRFVSQDDVLNARYGASIGRILRGKKGAINVVIVKTIPDEAKLSRSFLYFLLQKEEFQAFVRSLGGRSAQAGFNKGELNSFPILLPPLPEQQAIAEILRTVDRKIQAEERRKAALDALFKTLPQYLMTGKVRVPSEWIGQFQEENHEPR